MASPPKKVSKEVALQRLNGTENMIMGLAAGGIDVSMTQWMCALAPDPSRTLPCSLSRTCVNRRGAL